MSDLTVTSTASTSFTGNATAFQATLPAGVTATGYAWWWGNGNVSSTSGDSTSYAYPVAGIYLVYVQAVDSSGGVHDNLHNLLRRTVLASATNDVLGNYPGVAGSLVANTSTNVNATGAIAPGGFVTVENWIAGSPSDPQWTPSTPSYSVDPAVRPYTTLSASIVNVTGINGVTAAFAANTPNGSYWLEFSVPSSGPTGSGAGTVWANFSFTVFVENGSGVVAVSLPTSPHRGSLDVYAATSPYTLDPVLVYETAGSVDQNFLQTLILRNVSQDGSSPQDFVPNLATCVPGSALCQLLYGQSLVTSSGNFTFVLNPNASFYNATSGAHWQVQADDVAYSISRDCLETDYPTVETFPGWDLCQMLLPGPSAPRNASNLSWDGGLHYPYNSTPSNILSAVLVNDSLACPVGSHLRDGVHGNGCVTFVTSRTGHAWPQFLDPLATSWGAGILGCSWTGRSLDPARLPGWWNGSGCSPVEPGQPGGPAMPNDTAWDPMEEATAGTAYGAIGDAVAFDPVGSGPYAILSSSVSMGMLTEIQLTANPYWGGTPCIGGPLAGCLPPSNVGSANPSYFSSVTIYLNISGNSTLGMQSLASGTADLVDPNVNDLPTLLSYQGQGVAQIAGVPGITVLQLGMNLNYSISTADSILGASSTLPSTLLQDVNLRQFLINAYPWSQAQQQYCTIDGLQICSQLSGIIPAYMTGFTPTNLTWPQSNPSTDAGIVGSAAWWWDQAKNDGTVGVDCTPNAPCKFPAPALVGGDGWNGSLSLWAQSVQSISGGAILPVLVAELGGNVNANASAPPGMSGYPVQFDGWAPDYFDPSNYLVLDNDTFPWGGSGNSLQDLLQSQYESPCAGPAQDPQVSEACQGTAYQEMLSLMNQGGACAPPSCSVTQRELFYNEADHIGNSLGLKLPIEQGDSIYALGPWIDPSSIPRDPITGSAGTVLGVPYFDVRYASVIPPVYPLVVGSLNGVPSGSAPQISTGEGVYRVASLPTVETGETLLVMVSVTGGTGVYHYTWNGLPTGCTSRDAAAITCTPRGTGAFGLQVNVVDTRADHGSSPVAEVSVVQGPTITAFMVTPSPLTRGQAAYFSLSATGGIGGLSFSYAGLPSGCSAGNESSFHCIPSTVGSFTVVAFARDTIGVVAVANATLDVVAPSTPSSGYSLVDLMAVFGGGAAVGAATATLVVLRWTGKRERITKPPSSPG